MTIAARQTLEPNEADGRPQFLPIAAAFEWETAMLDAVAGGAGLQVMVWRCERCIVVPRRLAASAAFPAAARELERRGFPVVVRNTGGDAVVQGPGVVNVSLAFAMPAKLPDRIGHAYRFLCAPLMSLLRKHGIETANGAVAGAMCDGTFNIIAMDRKLAGTAQRWRRAFGGEGDSGFAVLGHLALSADLDHAAAADAINAFYAAAGIDSRVRGDAHVNIAELLPSDEPVTAETIVQDLASCYLLASRRDQPGFSQAIIP
ncbi:lipoate--protein ligase family protein [Ollibium composti]|uniref:Lipoate--protein ligase family protein n=1 Tax=Ollibium composti TaxID=2675109 RepID=A0ABY2Q0V3_9HYPH|nr:lipoate--protein ligase family protein [Mesorhizobium composti]THF54420.1 lipoate--protein ligase family protein [Mesorhizobium composti]